MLSQISGTFQIILADFNNAVVWIDFILLIPSYPCRFSKFCGKWVGKGLQLQLLSSGILCYIAF